VEIEMNSLTIRSVGIMGIVLLSLAPALSLTAGCRPVAPTAPPRAMPPAPSAPVKVGAAPLQPGEVPVLMPADLNDLLSQVEADFAAAHPEAPLHVTIKPTAALREAVLKEQLDGVLFTLGPLDLVPLDQKNRLAAGSGVDLAVTPLVVVVAKGNPLKLTKLDDLQKAEVKRIALGDKPAGAVGKEAEEALRKGKLWPKVQARVQRVAGGQLVAEVAEGRAQAAVVCRHQVTDQVAVAFAVARKLYNPIRVMAVRTSGCPAEGPAKVLMEFLSRPEAVKPLLDRGLEAYKPPKTGDKALFMFCGAGLREAAEDLIAGFQAKTGAKIEPTYTGSGCLLAQITLSESGDLYLPGEDYYMDMAQKRGYVTASRTVAYFVPVIMVQKGNPKGIHSLQDLMQPKVRVGIGEPKACAIGDFTPKVLAANGIAMEQFEKNVTAQFATAPELGNALKLGGVDAIIQWDALAHPYLDAAEVVPIPTTEKTVSSIPLGVLKFSQQPELAKQFLDFVAGPEGQALFRKRHYTLDPAHPVFPAKEAQG
jgi:molybdate transport system substrate-binding protein